MSPVQSPFPPSFDGNPWTYGLALFSLTLVSSLALAQLLHIWFAARRGRQIDVAVGNLAVPPPAPWSVFNVNQAVHSALLLTICLGAAPDVMVLFAWGEGSERTMEVLFLLDRLCDAATIVPFAAASALATWQAQASDHLLRQARASLLPAPSWRTFRDRAKISGAVLVIAVGVTIGKAGA